uniref:Immunoglobulin domain-containing protein n=1 Tax=Sinocyclocheilus anshuiensis TaxID=1608454 RepID=A0A671NKK4_9TELE
MIFLFSVVAGAPVTVTGHRGHRLDIRCPYESGYGSNSKYFCKGKCNFANIMVKSGSPAKDQRFSLTDDTTARVFTITVTDLRTEDAGQYWSAVKRILTDVYSEMLLLVKQVCVDITVKGTEGEQATIKCPYAKGYEKSYKYFQKGIYKDNNIILTSDGGESSVFDGRFSLRDDHQMRIFTVTIRNLRMADAGPYGCRLVSQLHRKQDRSRYQPVYRCGFTLVTRYNDTFPILYNTDLASVAGGLGSVLLVLVLCSGTFLILKKRKRKSGTALFQQNVPHNTEADRMYEEILNSDVVAAASSSNQTPASHLNTRPQVSTVYATVTNQKPDSNPRHTHSTNQVTDTDCDYYANIKSPEPTTDSRIELIYATATHPQNIKTNEGPIYSTINHK